ncbi:hypothetical protein Q3G72_010377 [Acer saccharum]|nr:hypothetical protein Q3G72_010377 [Acer saccharum]
MNINNLAPILQVNKSILMATKGRIDMLVRFSCLLLLLMGGSYSQRDKLLQGEELKDGDELLSTFVQPKEIKWRIIAIVGALVVILLCSLSYVARRKYKRKEEKWWFSLTVAVGIVLLLPQTISQQQISLEKAVSVQFIRESYSMIEK